MLRLAFDFIITWRETRTRPNAYFLPVIIRLAPSWEKALAAANPIPLLPPTTKTFFPSNKLRVIISSPPI